VGGTRDLHTACVLRALINTGEVSVARQAAVKRRHVQTHGLCVVGQIFLLQLLGVQEQYSAHLPLCHPRIVLVVVQQLTTLFQRCGSNAAIVGLANAYAPFAQLAMHIQRLERIRLPAWAA